MKTLYLILYILSAVMFLIAALTHYRPVTDVAGNATGTAVGRIHFLALGLLFWVLVPLIVTARSM